MTADTFASWILRGLGGITNMFEMLERDQYRLTAGAAQELKAFVKRLQVIIDHAKRE